MYEQDIELAKLLLSKLEELDERGESVRTQLDGARDELEDMERERDERSQYLDVLTRAAELLERSDLAIDSPATSELEERVKGLQNTLDEINQEVAKYRGLVDELKKQAPKLLEAVETDTEEQPPFSSEAIADDQDQPLASANTETPEIVSIELSPESDQDDEASEIEPEEEVEASEAFYSEDEAQDEEQSESVESDELVKQVESGEQDEHDEQEELPLEDLFVLKDLLTKEVFTFGKGSFYIVDASSAMHRVPRYDQHFRALSANQVRDELITDLDRLSTKLSGDFIVVFDSWHQTQVTFSNHVEVSYLAGDGEGDKDALNEKLNETVAEKVAMNRTVCLVTGDANLTELVSDKAVHVISLSEFFNT